MNKIELKNILSAKFDFDVWKEILSNLFSKIELFNKEVQVDASLIKRGGHVGNIRLDDGRSLAIFKFEVADNINISRNRKGLRDIASKYVDQSLIHGALVLYYSDNQTDYRLTFVAKQTSFNEDGQLVKTETAPKRYTFLLGPNESCTTAANRLHELIECKRKNGSIYLADVTEAFSVERLNKEFFDGYKKQYQKFLGALSDTKQNRDYVKKLLGRIVFLHFLQKKGWMGVPASNSDWTGGDKNYMLNLINRYKENDRLLSDVLEPLFFNTLNQPRPDDLASPVLGENIKIPYLNGGLFDKDDLDRLDIDFTYDYFKDLMEFFSQYNFTIDENDPDYSEVGIDPEMLGHIFENLLEDNKDKGAFYTPKEIVQYMSQESVIQYLKTKEPDEKYTEAIEHLVHCGEVDKILQEKSTAIQFTKWLAEIKVCDPAIGSGAFPMGILNVLFHARQLLYGFTKDNHAFSPADVKREIIQNNIYGVDIEQGAVDIARLRFWLSLVVDEERSKPLPNLDYKIMCGNSLLHRFALDAPFQQVFKNYNQKNGTNYTLDDYRQWVYDYTNISDHIKKDAFNKKIEDIKQAFKTKLTDKEKGKIAKVRGAIDNLQHGDLFGEKKKEAEKRIKTLQKELKKLEQQRAEIESNKIYEQAFEWRFEFPALLDDKGEFVGFDIVIGNPPYISAPAQIADEQLAKQRKAIIASQEFKSLFQKWDLYIPFIEFGMNHICKPNGLCTMIVPYPLTNQLYAKVLRKMIISSFDMFEVADLNGTKIFENATVSNCIPFIRKSKGGQTVISHIDNKMTINKSFVKEYKDLIQDEDSYVWNLTQEVRTGSRHPNFNVLGDYCYISKGMVLNADEKKAKGEFVKENLISNRKDEQHPREYIEAKDIERYRIKNVRYLEYDTPRCPAKLSRPTFRELYNSDKIIMNCLGTINCTLDVNKHYLHNHSIYCSVLWKDLKCVYNKSILSSIKKFSRYNRDEMENLSEGIDLRFLLGVMNSSYVNVLLRDLRGGDYHIYPDHIRNIPIAPATEEQQQQIINLVDVILAAKHADANADTLQEERQIDLLVYNLYGLTYDEIGIIDSEIHITREEFANFKQ